MSAPSSPRRSTPNRVGPGVPLGITEAMIARLVHAFYGKTRTDSVLGPIFERAIGENWDPHLAKMCNFWSSVVLMSGRYKGTPMAIHAALEDLQGEMRSAHFARWLDLFRETAAALCPPEAAGLFIDRAEMIAQSLQLGIAVARGEIRNRQSAAE